MLKILRKGPNHAGLSHWALDPMTKEAEGHLITHREDDVKKEAEIGEMQPQAKGCLQLPEEARSRFTSRASLGSMALSTP